MSDTSSPANVNALCGTLLALAVVTIALRFYTRTVQKLSLGIDDWVMVPCVFLYLGACIVVFMGVNDKVFGYATSSFTRAQVMSMAKLSAQMQIAWDILSTCALACIKISALFFYRRIFCVSGRKARFSIITIATAIIVFLWLITFLFLTGFQCGSHFSALWDGTYLKYCTISFPFLYGLVISDLLLDIWILVLPIPQIMKLHTTKQRKMAISGVFLLAFIGLGASIARMVVYIQVETAGPEALVKYDEEITITKGLYFSMLEAGMSLIAVNLPSLWFLFSKKALAGSLRSIRSVLSLRSSTASSKFSHPSREYASMPKDVSVDDSFSLSSHSNLARETKREPYENFAMHDRKAMDEEKVIGTEASVVTLGRSHYV